MTVTLEIIANGTTYDLSDRARYLHKGNSGFGMAPVSRWSEQGALQHGATDVGFQLRPRTMQLAVWLMAPSQSEYFDMRDEVMEIFAPRNEALKLRLTMGDRVRQIDCHVTGDLLLPSADKDGFIHRFGVTLVAPDPTWYDPTGVTTSFAVAAGGASMSVPLAVPWNIGSSIVNQSLAITNEGTWRSYPIITIFGPVTSPQIVNTTTGETLDFTGTTIAGGDYYVIDCRYGHKTIVDSTGTNKISQLVDGSDLSTFHLASRADTPEGINSCTVTGTGATAVTQVYIAFNPRYVGI